LLSGSLDRRLAVKTQEGANLPASHHAMVGAGFEL